MSPLHSFASRHLEGWQAGLVFLGMVSFAVTLVVPIPIDHDTLPLPRIDRREAARTELEDADLARRAVATGLPYEVRAVGEALRRLGRKEADAEDGSAPSGARRAPSPREQAARSLRLALALARKAHADETLRELRAIQTAAFVRAGLAARAHAPPSGELLELGGAFFRRATQCRWILDDGIRLTATELAALFRDRWNRLLHVENERPFRTSLNERRIVYHLLLRFPSIERRTDDDFAELGALDARRLGYLQQLAEIDPEYPTEIARASIYARGNHARAAATELHQYLARADGGGPWYLRARNHYERTRAAFAAADVFEDP